MKKPSMSQIRDTFFDTLSEKEWALCLNGIKRKHEDELGQVLSIDKLQKVPVGTYSLEELSAGIEIAGRKIQLVLSKGRGDHPTYNLTIDKESKIIFLHELQGFGEYLLRDYDGSECHSYYLTEKNNTFSVFDGKFVSTPAISRKNDKINIINPEAANYMFRKRFDKLYISYLENAKKYTEVTQKLLTNLNNFITEKSIDKTNVKFLFLDRDAIVFEYIGKRLSEGFGFQKSQFEGLLLPQDLESTIRKENKEQFEKMHKQGTDNKKGKIIYGSNKDQLIIPDSESLQIYGKYIQSLTLDDRIPIIIDTGFIGTSLRIAKDLIKYFHPETGIYSGLIYGQPDETAQYRDFTSEHAGISATQKFLENWPKQEMRLLKLAEDEDGKIIPQRGSGISKELTEEIFNTEGIDPSGHIQQMKLDENQPLNAEVFHIALSNMLSYIEKGTGINNGNLERRVLRERGKYIEKKYGL